MQKQRQEHRGKLGLETDFSSAVFAEQESFITLLLRSRVPVFLVSLLIEDSVEVQRLVALRHQLNENEVRKKTISSEITGEELIQGVRVGPAFKFKGYNGEIPTIGDIPTMEISSDKRVKESSCSF